MHKAPDQAVSSKGKQQKESGDGRGKDHWQREQCVYDPIAPFHFVDDASGQKV